MKPDGLGARGAVAVGDEALCALWLHEPKKYKASRNRGLSPSKHCLAWETNYRSSNGARASLRRTGDERLRVAGAHLSTAMVNLGASGASVASVTARGAATLTTPIGTVRCDATSNTSEARTADSGVTEMLEPLTFS